jgi:hypothetical protein
VCSLRGYPLGNTVHSRWVTLTAPRHRLPHDSGVRNSGFNGVAVQGWRCSGAGELNFVADVVPDISAAAYALVGQPFALP